MKQKSNKLRKLENNRYSIFTENMEKCYFCGKSPVDCHEVYGGTNRKQSMIHGLCIPLCRRHHRMITDNPEMSARLKIMCQEFFEENHSRQEFINIIGKNYL